MNTPDKPLTTLQQSPEHETPLEQQSPEQITRHAVHEIDQIRTAVAEYMRQDENAPLVLAGTDKVLAAMVIESHGPDATEEEQDWAEINAGVQSAIEYNAGLHGNMTPAGIIENNNHHDWVDAIIFQTADLDLKTPTGQSVAPLVATATEQAAKEPGDAVDTDVLGWEQLRPSRLESTSESEAQVDQQVEEMRKLAATKQYQGIVEYLNTHESVGIAALCISIEAVAELRKRMYTYGAVERPTPEQEEACSKIERSLESLVPNLEEDDRETALLAFIYGDLKETPMRMIFDKSLDAQVYADLLLQEGEREYVLLRLKTFTDIDSDELIQSMYLAKESRLVLNALSYIPDIDRNELAQHLLEDGETRSMMHDIEKFPDVDVPSLIDRLYETRNETAVMMSLHKIPGVDFYAQIERYYKVGEFNSIAYYEDLFPALSAEQLREIEPLIRAHNDYATFAHQREVFPDLSVDELIDGAIEYNDLREVLRSESFMKEAGVEQVTRRIIESGNAHVLVDYLDDPKFQHLDFDEILDKTIESGNFWGMLRHIEKMPVETHQQTARKMIQYGYTANLFNAHEYDDNVKDKSMFLSLSRRQIEEVFYEVGEPVELIKYRTQLPEHNRDRLLQATLSLFDDDSLTMTDHNFLKTNEYLLDQTGSQALPTALVLANRYMAPIGVTFEGYRTVKELERGESVPEAAMELGVTQSGVKGLEQFGQAIRTVATELRQVNLSPEALSATRTSELYQSILRSVYGVATTEYGDTSNESVMGLAEHFERASSEGKVAPLAPYYTAATQEISLLEGDERTEIPDEARARYAVLHRDIISAVAAVENRRPVSEALSRMGNTMKELSTQLDLDLGALGDVDPNDKKAFFKAQNLRKKRETLHTVMSEASEGQYIGRNFALNSPEVTAELFSKLEEFDELHSDMRQVVFSWALHKNPSMLEALKESSVSADIESIGVVSSFVDQIVNKETFSNFFPEKRMASRFRKLTSVKSLEDALTRHQQLATKGPVQRLDIIPTRGFAMELSGHVGDACWANKYESIAEEFPNMTSIIFKRGEDGAANERLVGSAMLIETIDNEGDPVLVLRGLNPKQNYINKVSIPEFYDYVTGYVRNIAERQGMRPAIVIDEHSGASGTNRPALHDHIAQLQSSMEKILVDADSTTFNGYDVTEKTYAL